MNASWLRWLPSGLSRQLQDRHVLQKILGNSGWLVADKLARLGFGLLVSVWMARHFGPSDFGALNYAVALSGLVAPLATVGLNTIAVRELVRRPEHRSTIIASALSLRLLGGVLAAAIALGTAYVLDPRDTRGLALVAILSASLLAQAAEAIEYDFQARMDVRVLVLLKTGIFFFCALLKIGLIVGGGGLLLFAAVVSLESFLSAAALVAQERRTALPFSFSDRAWPEARELLRSGWPMILAGLSIFICMRMDQIMLGQMLDDRAVGVFSAAVRISEAWYFVPMTIMSAAAPALTALHARSSPDYEHRLLQLVRLLTWLAVVVALVTTLLARPVVALLYGDSYREAADVLALHAWSGIFVGFGLASGPWLANNNALQHTLYQTMAGAVTNVIANLVLIPSYGATGAALATLLSQGVSGLLFNAVLPDTRPLFRLQLRSLLFI